MSLFWFLVIIGVSVFVHELGHYLAARLQGVRVKAFSVGFGPVLWRREAWGTEWRLSAIPLGGYADIEGLLPEEKGRGYDALPFLGKLLVLVAGVAMNVLLAWGLLAYLFSAQGVPEATGRAVILEVLPGSVAEEAGLKPGDILLAVDGKPLERPQEIERLKTPGAHTLAVLRQGEEVTLSLTWEEGMERLGVVYQPEVAYRRVGFLEGLGLAAGRTLAFGPALVQALVGGLLGVLAGNPDSGVLGPVGGPGGAFPPGGARRRHQPLPRPLQPPPHPRLGRRPHPPPLPRPLPPPPARAGGHRPLPGLPLPPSPSPPGHLPGPEAASRRVKWRRPRS